MNYRYTLMPAFLALMWTHSAFAENIRDDLDIMPVQSLGSTAPGLLAMIPPNQQAHGTEQGKRSEATEQRQPAVGEQGQANHARQQGTKGRLGIHAQYIYGVLWLGQDILDMGVPKQPLAPASVEGLSLRLTYGLTKGLSLEAEVMGASSNQACFEGVTVLDEGMMRMGDVYRSAALGRLQGGLMMRFGDDTFRPLVRLGLGLQGAGQSAEIIEADGMPIEELDAPFALDVIAAIGSGLDVWAGQHFVVGFQLTTVFSAKKLMGTGTSGSIEAGFHLGYSWSASR